MYILIMEDNSMVKASRVTEDDLNAANDGIMSIIDTTNCTEYYNNEWHDIAEYVQSNLDE